jgi:Ca2+-binding EF-hand superfamily protein
MKFATAALIATAAAIKIKTKQGGCVDGQMSDEIFKHIDTNNNGEINENELVTALKAFAKENDYHPTDADWKWVEEKAGNAAKADGKPDSMNPEEFNAFVNEFAEHFGLCDGGSGPPPQECVNQEMADQLFDEIDTNHNDKINKKELVTALKEFAKQEGHTIT